LYTIVSRHEPDPQFKKMFLDLKLMADAQAAIWASQLPKGTSAPVYQPNLHIRFIAQLLKIFSPRKLRFILAATKVRGMAVYRHEQIGHHFPTVFGELEPQHKRIQNSGNIRAAIFGVNDGLLSNASLILGIAGAHVDLKFILISGISGLLAGACSMGAGEYVSVRSQREMLEYQLQLEKEELEVYPDEEAEELALIYQARGIPIEEARKISKILIQNPEKALDTLAREELGINPEDLGSPWGAAIASFFSFALGALVPLLPYCFASLPHQLLWAIGLTGLVLFTVGAILSLFTQKSALWSGLRMLMIGACAGGFTYFIGHLFGVGMG